SNSRFQSNRESNSRFHSKRSNSGRIVNSKNVRKLTILQYIIPVIIFLLNIVKNICGFIKKIFKIILKDERPIVMGLKFRQIIPILVVIIIGIALVSSFTGDDSSSVQPIDNTSNNTTVVTDVNYDNSTSNKVTVNTYSNEIVTQGVSNN
ncbi:MAG: hypothetical protein Q4P14_06220, partial [Methanobacteriaceae archaeon]|nr:hypothetical protein [Methanobacteriaceae archaeon]